MITERPCPHCWVAMVWIDDVAGYCCPNCKRFVCVPRLRGRFSTDGTQWVALTADEPKEEQ